MMNAFNNNMNNGALATELRVSRNRTRFSCCSFIQKGMCHRMRVFCLFLATLGRASAEDAWSFKDFLAGDWNLERRSQGV